MKKCAYCGRENEENGIRCQECGSAELRLIATTVPTMPPNQTEAGAVHWLVAMLMFLAFFAGILLATNCTQALLQLRGFSGSVSAMVVALWLPLPLWMLLASLLSAPMLRRLGMLQYYSPLFLVTGNKERHLYLHGATLFDYLLHMRWAERGAEARRKTLRWYIEGVLALIRDIECGRVPSTVLITATSHIFSANRARRLGFQVECSWRFGVTGLLSYPTGVLTYSFAQGRLAWPNLLRAKKASIRGAQLLEQKAKLEALLEHLRASKRREDDI